MDTQALQLRQQIERTRAGIDTKLTQLQQHLAQQVAALLDLTVLSPVRAVQETVITSTKVLQEARYLMTGPREMPASQIGPGSAPLAMTIPRPSEWTASTPSQEPPPVPSASVAVYERSQPTTAREANPSASAEPAGTTSERRPSPWKFGGLSVKELGRRVIHEIQNDDCLGRAAQLAYYFLFALFPFFLFLTTLLGYLPIPDLLDRIMDGLAELLPGDALRLVQDNIHQLVTGERGGLLSFGILAALWTSSSALTAIIDSLNRAYGVEEGRPFWKVRGIAIALTVGLSAFIIVALVLLTFGPQLGRWVADLVGLGEVFAFSWNILRWPVIVGLLIIAMAMLYYFAPDVEQEWQWITPGSALAVIGWLLSSLGFAFYVNNFGSYNATYGSIGAVIVLLTWMYVSGLFVLIGGEINAEIEHASQDGKEPGEKQLSSS
jgi:membrane protein